MNQITKTIKDYSLTLGINKIGITTAENLYEAEEKAKFFIEKGLIPQKSGWSRNNISSFYSPSSFMPGARSVIMAALCYYEEKKSPEKLSGKIAMYTWRNNYKFLRKKLEKLGKFLKKNYEANCRVFVNSSLSEKPLAKRAGLGNYGKNTIFYTDTYGSRTVLGGLVTDMALTPNIPEKKDICMECNLCMTACPTGAIIEPYVLDSTRCFQYLGQHIHEEIPVKWRKLWGNRLYGCSTCQDVCPLNKKVIPVKELSPYGVMGPGMPLLPLLEMEEKEFREKYRGNQVSAKWVDFNAIRRNAVISIGNLKEKKAIPLLKRLEDNEIKNYIRWAMEELVKSEQ